jgi:deazaflavin-dependent oxidoreductase (nitroreductase family)
MANQDNKPHFLKPTAMDRFAGQVFTALLKVGIGFKHNFILEVRGRKSGKVFATPVNLLFLKGKTYLCASRGETQWVRNARAAGRVALVKGSQRAEYVAAGVAGRRTRRAAEGIPRSLRRTVQRYYPVKKGAPVGAFEECAKIMPVFELIKASN